MLWFTVYLLAAGFTFFGVRLTRALWQRSQGNKIDWRMWGLSFVVLLAGASFVVQQLLADYLTRTSTILLSTMFGAGAYAFGTRIFYHHFLPFFRKPQRNWAPGFGWILAFIILATIIASFVVGDSNLLVWYLREVAIAFISPCYLGLASLKYILPALHWMYLVEDGPVAKYRLLVWTSIYWFVIVWMVGELIVLLGWIVLDWPFREFDVYRPYMFTVVGLLWVIGYFAPAKWFERLGYGLMYLSSVGTFTLLWVIGWRIQQILNTSVLDPMYTRYLLVQPDYVVYEMVIRILDHRKLLAAQESNSPGWLLGQCIGVAGRPHLKYSQVLSILRMIGSNIIKEKLLFHTFVVKRA